MLRVTIELWPYGNMMCTKILKVGEIINDETGNEKTGSYICYINDQEIRVKNFSRTSSVWKLLYLALKEVFEK